MNWQNIISKLPGIYLQDQQPEGSGLAVSIVPNDSRSWIIYYAVEQSGKVQYKRSQPLSAEKLYRALDQLYADIGYVPQISAAEREKLHLPALDSLSQSRIPARMPGTYIGALEIQGNTVYYSLKKNQPGAFTLYSCMNLSENLLTGKLEIEPVGTFTLPEILEELLELGFSADALPILTEIHAESWKSARIELPGYYLSNQNPEKYGWAFSLSQQKADQWTLYETRKTGDHVYKINPKPNCTAKDIYHLFYEQYGILPAKKDIHFLKLPSLVQLFAETLNHKLKGYFLGDFRCIESQKPLGEIYLSTKAEKDAHWVFYYITAENLLTCGKQGKKIAVHKLGPYRLEDWQPFLEEIGTLIDPFELPPCMLESKYPEVRQIANLIHNALMQWLNQ